MLQKERGLAKEVNQGALARIHHEPETLDDRGIQILDWFAALVVAKLLDRLPALLATESNRLAYNLDQFAEATTLSRRLIENYIADGTLPSTRVGRRQIILRENGNQFLRGMHKQNGRRGLAPMSAARAKKDQIPAEFLMRKADATRALRELERDPEYHGYEAFADFQVAELLRQDTAHVVSMFDALGYAFEPDGEDRIVTTDTLVSFLRKQERMGQA